MSERGTSKASSTVDNELKPEQQKVLEEIYLFEDSGHINEADLKLAAEMFDTPQKFQLLRKIFGVLTQEERGLTMISPQSLIEANVAELNKYAIETAVNNLAQEKIRNSLFSFYRNVRAYLVKEKKAQFEEENQAEFDEEKRREAHKAENPEGPDLGSSL